MREQAITSRGSAWPAASDALAAGVLIGLYACAVAGVFVPRPAHVLLPLSALLLTAALLYLLRFARRGWAPACSTPFPLHVTCAALTVVPCCLTSHAPLRSLAAAAAALTVLFAHHAFREAFAAGHLRFLSPRSFAVLTTAAAAVLVFSRFGAAAARAPYGILPWYCLSPPAGVPAREFDHLPDLLLLLAFPVAAVLARFPGARAQRLLGAGACVLIVAAVILCFSRGAWLALAVQGALLVVVEGRAQRRGAAAAAVVLALAALAAALPALRERAMSVFDVASGTGAQRLDQWAVALAGIIESPVLGHGLGTFGDLYAAARGGEVWYWCPHNLYLHIAVECGIPALCIFLGWVFLLVRQLAPSRRRALVNGVDWRAAMFHAGIISVCGLLAYGFVDL